MNRFDITLGRKKGHRKKPENLKKSKVGNGLEVVREVKEIRKPPPQTDSEYTRAIVQGARDISSVEEEVSERAGPSSRNFSILSPDGRCISIPVRYLNIESFSENGRCGLKIDLSSHQVSDILKAVGDAREYYYQR